MLGEDIRGSGFSFDVTVLEGAGSYVVGEETALLACVEGLRGTVSARPPFPAQRGLYGMPTVVNNIETLANIPFVARHGAEAYRALCPARARARSSSASTSASCGRASTRCASARRCASSARTSPAACATATRSARADRRAARRDPARVAAGHAVRLRRARRGRLHGRPRRHRRLRRAHRHARRRPPPPALRRRRELRQVLPLPDRAAPRVRDVRRRRAGRPRAASRRCSRRSSWAACAPTAAACPAPMRSLLAHFPDELGLRLSCDGQGRSTARCEVTVDGRTRSASRSTVLELPARRSSRRPGRRPLGPDRSASTTARPPSARAASAWSAVEGTPGPLPACTTPCRDGMEIDTAGSDRAPRRPRRRRARPLRAAGAARTAHRARPGRRAARRRRARAGAGAVHPHEHDVRHPYLAFRHELCISCGRCVRACDEIQGAFALTATGRGFEANIAAGLDAGFEDSTCVSCGACADTCPTDAITEISLVAQLERELEMATATTPEAPAAEERFDRVATTTCGYCGVGCRLETRAIDGRVVSIAPALDGPANEGHTCLKGRFAHGFTRSPRPAEDAADPRRRRAPPGELGGGARPHRRRTRRGSRARTAPTRSPASPPRARPTRTATRCRA